MPQTYRLTRRPRVSGTPPSGGPSSTSGWAACAPVMVAMVPAGPAPRLGVASSAMAGPEPFAIVAAAVLDGAGGAPVRDQTVVVAGGRVERVGPAAPGVPPEGAPG